jgi:hypothetical protein
VGVFAWVRVKGSATPSGDMAAEVNEGGMRQVARFDYVDRPGAHNLRVYLRSLDRIPVGGRPLPSRGSLWCS